MKLKKIIYLTLKVILITLLILLIFSILFITQMIWGIPFGTSNHVDPADITPPPPVDLPLGAPCEPLDPYYGKKILTTENGVSLDTLINVNERDYWGNPFPMKAPLGYINRDFPGIRSEYPNSFHPIGGGGTKFRIHMPDQGYDYTDHNNYVPPDFCKDGIIVEEVQQYLFEFEIDDPVEEGEPLNSLKRGSVGTLTRNRDVTLYKSREDYPHDLDVHLGLSSHYYGHSPGRWYEFEEMPGSPYLVTGWCHPLGVCGVLAEFPDRDYAVKVYADKRDFHLWPEMLETAMLFIEEWRVDPNKPSKEQTAAEIKAIIKDMYYE